MLENANDLDNPKAGAYDNHEKGSSRSVCGHMDFVRIFVFA